MGACGLRQNKAVEITSDESDVVSGDNDENIEDGKRLHFIVVLWLR